jgi:putative ABC transport system substrate-binding protein
MMARSQESGRIARIAILAGSRNNPITGPGYQAFVEELRKLGFSEGRNIVIDTREAEQEAGGFSSAASELSRLNPDVIFSSGPEAALKALIAEKVVAPIVILGINYDPIALGYVKSLAQPGGMITGLFLRQTELAEKQVELLTQAFPERRKLVIVWDRFTADQFAAAERRAKSMSLEVHSVKLENAPYDFRAALQTLPDDRAQMALILSSPYFAVQSQRITELAIQKQLPAMFIFRGYVQDGGLMSYGANAVDMYRQAATYVAKLLQGAKPADLPIELPKTFELAVNLRTAKAMGIEIPTSILLRANEVIE